MASKGQATVLYEMLTGGQAFAGETGSDSIAAILGREPEWALLDDAPPQVRRLLALADMGDWATGGQPAPIVVR